MPSVYDIGGKLHIWQATENVRTCMLQAKKCIHRQFASSCGERPTQMIPNIREILYNKFALSQQFLAE
jgi:hypothetical protein